MAAEEKAKVVSYSFRLRFVAPILSGTKTQTIRADRKRHARPGEEMQLYTGLRTKQCRLIARATCLNVKPIRLSFHHGAVAVDGCNVFGIVPELVGDKEEDGTYATYDLNAFARRDGFSDWADMREFWSEEHGEPDEWNGVLITWILIRPEPFPPEG